ncbi:class I SAM-dependent methyltransferase [Streptomyces litchfieldiae]|uniref:Class I SAM-dependent methyltransferase n=1 Tax=Streptomyces litchfieldiae TaxID=3075543 RepID=A0ABU2MUR7_9ACTN|nr:class I SAM-dependent methyltransferase [Streptomyces sp. DSM 44938]MDT0344834.1 class I SAM-dependent methyltransferase [Streptomyces sp. DSM 44938]
MTDRAHDEYVELNRRHWDDHAAGWHGPLARSEWSAEEPHWGLWATPESQVSVFPDDIAGMRAIELGCGTGYVSAWLARAGASPVGIDLSEKQLATAQAMQEEFGLTFPLVLGNAEQVPYDDDTFDFAISDYGASLWCAPYRWIPEAARLLVPGGRLVFTRRSPLFALCGQPDGEASTTLLRPQFGLRRLDWGEGIEFTLPHGEMLRLLRSHGFIVEDLIEIQAPKPAHRDYAEVSADWAHHWPSEEIWKAQLAG